MSISPILPQGAPVAPAGIVPPAPAAREEAAAAQVPEAQAVKAGQSSLWELLTPEERAFFEEQMRLGPLTYSADRADSEGIRPPTGRRIDVRG